MFHSGPDAEIDRDNPLAGSELVYLRDPFDAFLLQVQGSGRIRLADGSVKSVRFAGHNGQEYNSIGKLLVDEGKLSRKEVSIPAIRRYLSEHPGERKRILDHNPRVVFFTWGDEGNPQGSLGQELTPGRSVAIDNHTLPTALFGYLASRKPVVDSDGSILCWKPLTRFVLPQDSGAAIRGAGRVDLFLGSGTYARTTAGHMQEPGTLYFLLAKTDWESAGQARAKRAIKKE